MACQGRVGTKNSNWNQKSGRKWFAYGLALDGETTAAFKGEGGVKFPPLPAGTEASLEGHAIVFTGSSPRFKGRVATLAPLSGERVQGVLYELDAAQWPAVEAFEKSLGGQARAVKVRVGKELVEATAFVLGASDAPEIDEGFLAALLRGMASAKLPDGYIKARAAEALLVERVQRVGREKGLIKERR